jgi:hypothetical protein
MRLLIDGLDLCTRIEEMNEHVHWVRFVSRVEPIGMSRAARELTLLLASD